MFHFVLLNFPVLNCRFSAHVLRNCVGVVIFRRVNLQFYTYHYVPPISRRPPGTENEHFTDHEKRRFSPIKTQQNSRFSSVFPMNHDFFHRSSARSAKNKTGRFQHRDVEFENPLDSAKNKTGRFQQRNASAQSAKNKTGRFQHRNAQFENPLCHDPLPYVVRLEERLHFMFLKITQLNDVLTSRIL